MATYSINFTKEYLERIIFCCLNDFNSLTNALNDLYRQAYCKGYNDGYNDCKKAIESNVIRQSAEGDQ